MDGLATAVLILFGIWLGILTLVMILVVRQIALLTVRFSLMGNTFSLANDGPGVGSPLPEMMKAMLPEIEWERAHILSLSANCTPCRVLAAELNGHRFKSPIIALLAGPRELADGLALSLPLDFRIVRDPDATALAQALQIKSIPFAVAVENGVCVRKAYMHSSADFVAVVESSETSEEKVLHMEVEHVN